MPNALGDQFPAIRFLVAASMVGRFGGGSTNYTTDRKPWFQNHGIQNHRIQNHGVQTKKMGYRTKPTRHTNHPGPRCERRGGGAPMRRRRTERRRRTQEAQAHPGSTGAFTKHRRTQETHTPPGGAGTPNMQLRPRF